MDIRTVDATPRGADERARAAGLEVLEWDLELDPRFRTRLSSEILAEDVAVHGGPLGAFYSSAARGFFVFTSYEMVKAVYQAPELFSSVEGSHLYRRDPTARALPMNMDAPEHTQIRQLLNPWFSPAAVQGKFEEQSRATARELVEAISARGSCELLGDLAEPLASAITLAYMGVSPELAAEMTEAASKRANPGVDEVVYRKAVSTIRDLFVQVLADRRTKPADDIPTSLLQARIHGEALPDEVVLDLCCTLLAAGVTTTSAELGFIFYYLATRPDLREVVVRAPDVIRSAVEEFLRYESSAVFNSRTVAQDHDFFGIDLRAGDRVLIVLDVANRDPAVFPSPDLIELRRTANRHLSFGLGPHRCIGSNLARLIMRVTVEEWHARIPDYCLGDMTGVIYDLAASSKMSAVPLVFPTTSSREAS